MSIVTPKCLDFNQLCSKWCRIISQSQSYLKSCCSWNSSRVYTFRLGKEKHLSQKRCRNCIETYQIMFFKLLIWHVLAISHLSRENAHLTSTKIGKTRKTKRLNFISIMIPSSRAAVWYIVLEGTCKENISINRNWHKSIKWCSLRATSEKKQLREFDGLGRGRLNSKRNKSKWDQAGNGKDGSWTDAKRSE